ncbi:hypothetical protein LLS1_07920 [Leifsonia sp. LS1]|uniref:helix-hairpin-helix domain-containing protein n=1 Tax=Leifsonia sp. LS1 TaxID=2828483 RepID=UPI001CFDB7B2|nr:helix-hairpin-helix domain-containing protein [Leifsonia sp. LS1]GIT79123.1 hypothetical protein LLS1_07920 [Leifsonia sp. LS1]
MRHRSETAVSPTESDAPSSERRRLRLGVGAVVVLLLGAFVVAILTSAFAQRGEEQQGVDVPSAPASAGPSPSAGAPGAAELFVHVSGAVLSPGLVTLDAGARVVDAIAAAGGLAPDADPDGVNLARPIADGEQLVVPREGEAPAQVDGAASGPGGGAAGASAAVNLNTAGRSELETLPRIGPALAQRILDWRAANGRFSQPSDLLQVTGIGEKVFDGLKDRVTV